MDEYTELSNLDISCNTLENPSVFAPIGSCNSDDRLMNLQILAHDLAHHDTTRNDEMPSRSGGHAGASSLSYDSTGNHDQVDHHDEAQCAAQRLLNNILPLFTILVQKLAPTTPNAIPAVIAHRMPFQAGGSSTRHKRSCSCSHDERSAPSKRPRVEAHSTTNSLFGSTSFDWSRSPLIGMKEAEGLLAWRTTVGEPPDSTQMSELADEYSVTLEAISKWFSDDSKLTPAKNMDSGYHSLPIPAPMHLDSSLPEPADNILRLSQVGTTDKLPDRQLDKARIQSEHYNIPCRNATANSGLERDDNAIFQCTRRCGLRTSRKNDWERHQELACLQYLWYCSVCPPNSKQEHHGFRRVDQLRTHYKSQHITKGHKLSETEFKAVAQASRYETHFPVPTWCGFCQGHKEGDLRYRHNHLAEHFKEDKFCMLDWKSESVADTSIGLPPDDDDEDDDNDDDNNDQGKEDGQDEYQSNNEDDRSGHFDDNFNNHNGYDATDSEDTEFREFWSTIFDCGNGDRTLKYVNKGIPGSSKCTKTKSLPEWTAQDDQLDGINEDSLSSLVVRGICDYSDSHKKKQWQGYAAMTTAAYTQDLLVNMLLSQVTAEKRVQVVLAEAERSCHQVLKTSSYEQSKNRNSIRVEQTCQWVLNHSSYQLWIDGATDDLLWISAHPGCGKSVFSKSLVDEELRSDANDSTVCYFFFKDNDEQNSLATGQCALLHQLFQHQPHLLQHAVPAWNKDGSKLQRETDELWRILLAATSDVVAYNTMCIIDALDECRDRDRSDLIVRLAHFHEETASQSSRRSWLKFIVTSRPYDGIQRGFQQISPALPAIHLGGEQGNDQIHTELNRVIHVRVLQLKNEFDLHESTSIRIEQALLAMEHCTYLWLHLAMDDVRITLRDSFRPFEESIGSVLSSVEDAYQKTLARVAKTQHHGVELILQIIAQARRPLAVSEMALAIGLATSKQHMPTTNAQIDPVRLGKQLRHWCGLFVVLNQSRIYLIHQTARESLIARQNHAYPKSLTHDTRRHCVQQAEMKQMMMSICMRCLQLDERDSLSDDEPSVGVLVAGESRREFIEYCCEWWTTHYSLSQEAGEEETFQDALALDNTEGEAFKFWFDRFWTKTREFDRARCMTPILLTALNNHDRVLEHSLDQRGMDVDAKAEHGRTKLYWASQLGHNKVVQMLLDRGTDVNAQSGGYGNALYAASDGGHDKVVQMLLDRGVDITGAKNNGLTPLHAAANNEYLGVVYLLIDAVANSNAQDRGKQCYEHDSSSGRIKSLEQMVMQLSILDFSRYSPSTEKESWYSERLLGQGSQAVVDAVRNHDGLRVARKTILRSHLARRSFSNEIRALRVMRHPHITQSLGTSLSDSGYSIYLYPVADTDFRSLMRQPIDSRIENALAQTACLVSALAQIHRKGFVHNDIKPANILIKRSTGYDQHGRMRVPDVLGDQFASHLHVILADFGLSRHLLDTSSLPQAYGRVTGTPMYTAPERISSPASDIWSLGCVFTEILTWYFHRPVHALNEYVQHQPYHANPELIRTWLKTLDPADDAEAVTMIALTQEMLSPSSEDRPTAKELACKLPWKCTCEASSRRTFT